jgi:hypothetical protein
MAFNSLPWFTRSQSAPSGIQIGVISFYDPGFLVDPQRPPRNITPARHYSYSHRVGYNVLRYLGGPSSTRKTLQRCFVAGIRSLSGITHISETSIYRMTSSLLLVAVAEQWLPKWPSHDPQRQSVLVADSMLNGIGLPRPPTSRHSTKSFRFSFLVLVTRQSHKASK